MTITKTVLIVEDEEAQRSAYAELLRLNGYEVLAAANGSLGLHMAREHRPDLILMNMNLPGLNGAEATDEIKSYRATRSIPVIVVSGFDGHDTLTRATEAGCDDYLVKPVEPKKLLDVISRFIGPGISTS
jgi:CheY-like chemotaxis protein